MQSEHTLDYLTKFDIVSLVETWTSCDEDVANLLNEYVSFSIHGKRRSRYGRNPGGITVFISERMKDFIQCIKVTNYAIFLKLDKSNIINCINDIIMCIYIFRRLYFYHNRIQSNGIQEFLDELLDVITPGNYMILLGDFNARTVPQPDYIIDDTVHLAIPDWFYDSFKISCNSRDNVINIYGNYLLDLCK